MYWPRRWRYPQAPTSPEEELKMLESYKRDLEREIEDVKRELKEVEERLKELREMPQQPYQPPQPYLQGPYAMPGPWGGGYGWGRGRGGGWGYGGGYGRGGGWWGAPAQPQPQAAVPPPPPGAHRAVAAVEEDAGIDSRISQVFGRAPYFAFIDIVEGEVKSIRILPNPMVSAPGGAGTAAAQWILSSGARSAIAPYLGPNVSMIFSQAGVQVYTVEPGTPLSEALKRLGLVK